MALVESFAAVRYDATRVDPDEVVAPPYDVVGPDERAALAARSPYNAIHVELPVADAERGLDRYENAAFTFRSWLEAGVVRRDDRPALYLYRISFHDERGHRREMIGVLGALDLGEKASGRVLPHEQTMPKDREDRLSLLRRTGLNTSPVWGLSLAEGLSEACRDALSGCPEPPWRAVEASGVVHELFGPLPPGRGAALAQVCDGAAVLLADGHHRYQVARSYAAECRAQNGGLPGLYDAVLAFVVELSERELSIGAVHRLVSGVDPARLVDDLAGLFRVESAPADLVALPATGDSDVIGLFTPDGYRLLHPLEALYDLAGDDLDVSRLAAALEQLGVSQIAYEPAWYKATNAVREGRADAAFLLRPVPVARIEAVAETGRLMPPKSTYFHPKPRTGMAFRQLD